MRRFNAHGLAVGLIAFSILLLQVSTMTIHRNTEGPTTPRSVFPEFEKICISLILSSELVSHYSVDCSVRNRCLAQCNFLLQLGLIVCSWSMFFNKRELRKRVAATRV